MRAHAQFTVIEFIADGQQRFAVRNCAAAGALLSCGTVQRSKGGVHCVMKPTTPSRARDSLSHACWQTCGQGAKWVDGNGDGDGKRKGTTLLKRALFDEMRSRQLHTGFAVISSVIIAQYLYCHGTVRPAQEARECPRQAIIQYCNRTRHTGPACVALQVVLVRSRLWPWARRPLAPPPIPPGHLRSVAQVCGLEHGG